MTRLEALMAQAPDDPYPIYDMLRGQDRMFWMEGGNRWLVTGHAEAAAVLRHPGMSSDRTRWDGYQPPRAGSGRGMGMFTMDPPEHTRLRSIVGQAFTPRMVEGLRPRIERLVAARLDEMAQRGTADLIADFAGPLPATVLAELLGIPAEDHEAYRGWATSIMAAIDPVSHSVSAEQAEAGRLAETEMEKYLAAVIDDRRIQPKDDLISAMVRVEAQGDRLSAGELFEMCILLTVAGLETTVNLIGNGVNALIDHPDELARLRADPAMIGTAVEELLRYDAPIQLSGRVPVDDLEIGGKTLRRGQMVGVILGAANRDERAFPQPHRLDLGRTPNNHLAFGRGLHFCLGAPLARIEGAIAISGLVGRFPSIERAGEPQRRSNLHVRGFHSLPVALS